MLNPTDRRFLRFFGFGMALSLIAALPSTIPSGQQPGPVSNPSVLLMGLASSSLKVIALVVWAVLFMRTSILFPAIAIDALDATWRNAMQRTKGHFWKVSFTWSATLLPLVVALAVVHFLSAKLAGTGLAPKAILVLLGAVSQVLALCAAAAVASALYRVLSAHLPAPTIPT